LERDFVRAWRLNRSRYGTKSDAFSGKGAATYPGRWNEPGIPVVYTTSSVALAVLEVLVHTRDRRVLNRRFSLFEVQIPAELITDPILPNDLREIKTTRQIGSQWVRKAVHPALRVPSIITGEPNYILNPNHPDFSKIEITEPRIFHFDERLFP
jgi:RES domain-containing protein